MMAWSLAALLILEGSRTILVISTSPSYTTTTTTTTIKYSKTGKEKHRGVNPYCSW